MLEDLKDEQEAILSIYGQQVLRQVDAQVYILSIPQSQASQSEISLRLSFPQDYPRSRPEVLGTETIGKSTRKGYGGYIVDLARQTLQMVFMPGSVCLFDLLQELEKATTNDSENSTSLPSDGLEGNAETVQTVPRLLPSELTEEPKWTISTAITEKKSTFLARACTVHSPQHAEACIVHLLDTDKRAAKATHNITAYRIQSRAATESSREVIYQDCNDDGEIAAGGRLLHLLQVLDVWGVLVVVSRWYGGIKLGPDRFSIINKVAREAVVETGWTKSRITKA